MNRLLATTLAIASLLPTACAGTHAEHPITIGVVVDCHGGFAQSREPSMAGAELPLLERGASRLGGLPSDGITDTTVGGRPVRLVEACESYADRRVTIDALTTLVEDDDADIVVGAPFNGDGIAVREFARHHADRTFLLTSFEQSPMMKRPASNTFRFELDAAQWGAGSGRFGHDRFGWKNPAVIEQAMPAWTSVAGIVAD